MRSYRNTLSLEVAVESLNANFFNDNLESLAEQIGCPHNLTKVARHSGNNFGSMSADI